MVVDASVFAVKLIKIGRRRSLAVSVLRQLIRDAKQHRPSPTMYLSGEHLAITSSALSCEA